MHTFYDQRLTDPTETELEDALLTVEAVAHEHRDDFILSSHESAVRLAAERVLREPEGARRRLTNFRRADVARISLGWWTNAGGRKLVRICGRRERHPPFAHWGELSEQDQCDRHAIWYLDPERVIGVTRNGIQRWIAVCGCGAVGSVEMLGWQHGMCGPCADRVAEFGSGAVTHSPGVLVVADFEACGVEFTPDGRSVVAIGADEYQAWHLSTGARYAGGGCGRYGTREKSLISPDGRSVFLDDSSHAMYWASLSDGKLRRTRIPELGELWTAFWTGRPDELLVAPRAISPFRLVNLTNGSVRDVGWVSAISLSALWPDEDAPRVVFAISQQIVVMRLVRGGTFAEELQFQLGDGTPNRTAEWTGGPHVVRFSSDGERLLLVRDQEMELWHLAKPKALFQGRFPAPVGDAAFAPDDSHLFVLTTDGTVHVCDPFTPTDVRAQLRWHVGPVSRLAVSPDNQLLATAGAEGVKLWPIGRLMSLLG